MSRSIAQLLTTLLPTPYTEDQGAKPGQDYLLKAYDVLWAAPI